MLLPQAMPWIAITKNRDTQQTPHEENILRWCGAKRRAFPKPLDMADA